MKKSVNKKFNLRKVTIRNLNVVNSHELNAANARVLDNDEQQVVKGGSSTESGFTELIIYCSPKP